jgi:coatomer subunit beta
MIILYFLLKLKHFINFTIYVHVGPLPLDVTVNAASATPEPTPAPATVPSGPKVNADGTYAYQSSLSSTSVTSAPPKSELDKLPIIRKFLVTGDFFLGSVVGAALTKLALRMVNSNPTNPVGKNMAIYAVSVICAIANFGRSKLSPRIIEEDSIDRLLVCVRTLLDPAASSSLSHIWLHDCRGAFQHLLQLHKDSKPKTTSDDKLEFEPDSLISFRQLRARKSILGSNDLELDDAADISKATEVNQVWMVMRMCIYMYICTLC